LLIGSKTEKGGSEQAVNPGGLLPYIMTIKKSNVNFMSGNPIPEAWSFPDNEIGGILTESPFITIVILDAIRCSFRYRRN
jgi:hypothetical protein